jgi:hypothetical protein
MRKFDSKQIQTPVSFTGSFSGSFYGDGTGIFSGSFSGSVSSNLQEITNNGAVTTNAITASGLQTSTLTVDTQTYISGTLDITGSAQLNNSPIITEAILYPFTTSYYVDSASIDIRVLNNSASIDLFSGSFIAFSGSYLTDSSSFDTRILTNSSSISLLSGSYLVDSASFDVRILNTSASIDILSGSFTEFSSSYLADSSSFDIRILNNSSSISTLSGNFVEFSGSYLTDSSSFDIRILNNSSSINLLSGSYLTDSSSFDTRILNNSASISLLSGSYLTDSSSFDTRILNNSASIFTLSGSFIGFSGSYVIASSSFDTRITNNSASIDLLTNNFIGFSGSYVLDSASFDTRILSNSSSISTLSGSYLTDSASFDTRILNNSSSIYTLSSSFDLFTQIYNTGSFTGSFTGSLFGTSSWATNAQTASYVLPLNQDVEITGSLNVSGSIDVTNIVNAFILSGSLRTDKISFTEQGTFTGVQGDLGYSFSDGKFTFYIENDVPIELGQTLYTRVRNADSVVLTKGTIVDFTSTTTGQTPRVKRAIATSGADCSCFVGIVLQNIGVNQFGAIMLNGVARGLNLTSFNTDDQLYLSSTISGSATTTIPTPPVKAIRIGKVLNASNSPTQGVLYVRPENRTVYFDLDQFKQTYNTGSFTGSFIGDGSGLYDIPASGIVGLNLSQIVSGSVSASISPNNGLQVNTNITATSFTGSLFGTSSWAQNSLTSSFALSGNGFFTGSFTGSFTGDGSQLTGIVSSKWSGSNPITRESDVEITGSFKVAGQTTLYTAGSGTLTVQGSGSAQPLFLVTGSVGELLSVTDSTSGSLLQIFDSSSNSIFTVNDQGEIEYGIPSSIFATKYTIISATASYQTIYNIQTGSYSGAFMNYTVISASNARAGQLMTVWNSGTSSYAETTTTDIGDTSQIAFDVIMTGNVARIAVSASLTEGWQVKTALNIL